MSSQARTKITSTRPNTSQGLDGWTRLLIVVLLIAVAAYLFAPFFIGVMRDLGDDDWRQNDCNAPLGWHCYRENDLPSQGRRP